MGLGRWDGQTPDATDHASAEAAVAAALDIGITTFDHADIYGHGSAEAVFGDLLSRNGGLRARIQIQTKCGIRLPGPDGPGIYDLRPETIRARVHESLDRLRTAYVDSLLLHRPDPLTDPAEIGATLTSLYDEGLVLAVGVSNMSAAQITALQAHTSVPITANQLEMSLLRRDWLEGGVLVNTAASSEVGFPYGTVEFCREQSIELQAWGALANGRFTGAPQSGNDEQVADLVAQLAEAHGTTPETVVLWWLQRHPAAIRPVIGTTNPSRIRACADAATESPRLSHEQWYSLWLAARGAPLP
ncbi:aldo/keto reductase [Nocardioides cavernaquae]|uniref:Aldo/keto reductase n=2 Tax=Nocardioides cavernaquae TaxID=2321396 RepID=A0A3A5HCH0_9ACTN|nr:aldo/keto reductase [Nocardioides cavernaquae]